MPKTKLSSVPASATAVGAPTVTRSKLGLVALATAGAITLGAPGAFAVTLDPLHGYCPGCVEITSGGNNVTTNPTVPPGFSSPFGFWLSSGPATADYRIDFAVPNNEQAGISSIAVTGTHGGTTNTSPIAATATAIPGEWTSGQLDAFLGANLPGGAQPNNPISNFLPFTQSVDAGATGYSLYQADLGNTTCRHE